MKRTSWGGGGLQRCLITTADEGVGNKKQIVSFILMERVMHFKFGNSTRENDSNVDTLHCSEMSLMSNFNVHYNRIHLFFCHLYGITSITYNPYTTIIQPFTFFKFSVGVDTQHV